MCLLNFTTCRPELPSIKGLTVNIQVNERAILKSDGKSCEEIKYSIGESSLGSVLVARSVKGICAVLIDNDPHVLEEDLRDQFPRATLVRSDTEFEKLVSSMVKFVEDPTLDPDLPLDGRGTDFQRRVWKAIREIPAGSTASYTEIANEIGLPKTARAVAQACAANRLAVIIPCHRVVRSNGGHSGYRWGVARKKILLQRETAK